MDDQKLFIQQRQDRWKRLEELLSLKKRSFRELRELGRLYQFTTDDLSHSQTHFENSEVSVYLNQLVRRCHTLFYRPDNVRMKMILRFFTDEFPSLIFKLIVPIALSFGIFLSSMGVSFFMVRANLQLGEIFLPETVYEMAVQDVELRKKFSNFDKIPEEMRTAISLYIWFNNSMVSLYCFVLGITLGLGTAYILIKNGFILGALFAIYYMNGHFLDFFSIIMVHGSIELIAIIIAGGAGFNVGLSLIYPGRQSRGERLKKNARTALLVLWGVISMLLIAGLIEGLITTLKLPIYQRIIIMTVNFTLLGLYFARGFVFSRK